jgi:hypothetical protein
LRLSLVWRATSAFSPSVDEADAHLFAFDGLKTGQI